ncbi:MAG TPA: MOSC domain-containing protein [Tetrasphaera sp.]|nr:MOSC domain-containing protein [Tetrasphaera sp.]
MTARIHSVNIGSPTVSNTRSRQPTGIVKAPTDRIDVCAPGPVKGHSGVVGDFIGSAKHHGGDGQAVYAVAREELDWWGAELGRELPDGMFGENLTTAGLDVDGALVDEVWRIGTAVLQVTGPRIPCSTFAGRMQEKQWVKRFAARGHTGAYLAVLQAGSIRVGDAVEILERPRHDVTVPVSFRAAMGDSDAKERFRASAAGSPGLRDYILA